MRVLLIGAGPTCIGFMYRYNELVSIHKKLGTYMVDMIEKSDACGGLASSAYKNGCTLDNGGHIFFSHYDYFSKILYDYEKDHVLKSLPRKAVIYIDGKMIPYPFQSNIHLLAKDKAFEMIREMRESKSNCSNSDNHSNNSSDSVTNFEEWGVHHFGKCMYTTFLKPLNEKSLTHPLTDIGTYWLSDRVNIPDLDLLEKMTINETQDSVIWGPNSYFHVPTFDGCGSLWYHIINDIVPKNYITLKYNTECISCIPHDNKVICKFSDESEKEYDIVVNSGPINIICKDMIPIVTHLKHNMLCTTGVCIRGGVPDIFESVSWIYLPEKKYIPYRVTVMSNYSRNNTIPDTYLLQFESSHPPPHPPPCDNSNDNVTSEADIKISILQFLQDVNVNIDDIVDIIFLKHTYNYPIPTLERKCIIDDAISQLDKVNIYQRGRFGCWKYEIGNMDHCFMQGVELCDKLFNDGKEITIHDERLVNSFNANIINHIVSIDT